MINCLALSDDCVFSNDQLARSQLRGEFDLGKKQAYLAEMLEDARQTGVWRDLGLGNSNLFGFDFFWDEVEPIFLKIAQYQISSTVNKIMLARKKFFLVNHDITTIPRLKQIWPCAKIILFVDYRSFIKKRAQTVKHRARQQGLQDYWQRIKDPSWPTTPPSTLTEFQQLPEKLRHELVEVFDFDISRWFDFYEIFDQQWTEEVKRIKFLYQNDTVTWDVEQACQGNEKLQEGLNVLANRLGFSLVDRDIISWYYDSWYPIVTSNIKQYEPQRSFI